MTGTYVKIAADGSVNLDMDLYYEETGMYHTCSVIKWI